AGERPLTIASTAKTVAAERFGSHKKIQRDMLGSFVAHGLTQKQAESEILLQIVAGSDTTATVIRSTMLHIMTTPRVLAKLLSEIESANLSAEIISDAKARTLPFLQAVIKEGMRIFPPVAGLMAKQAPPQGHYWKGVFIPGGTRVGSCAWGLFRREDIWGEDSQQFRPERWLESSPEELSAMEGALDLIFSYGRWQCLGRPIALMELNKVFVQVSYLLITLPQWISNLANSCFDGSISVYAIQRILGKCIIAVSFRRVNFTSGSSHDNNMCEWR
ncbi:hypothetical protein Golomagni_07632, partial [Golovinomyces magnicellulatus]